jgi:hypothetical protein
MLCPSEDLLYWLVTHRSDMLLALYCYAFASSIGYHIYALISASTQNLSSVSKPTHDVGYEMFKLRTGHEPHRCETLVKCSGSS